MRMLLYIKLELCTQGFCLLALIIRQPLSMWILFFKKTTAFCSNYEVPQKDGYSKIVSWIQKYLWLGTLTNRRQGNWQPEPLKTYEMTLLWRVKCVGRSVTTVGRAKWSFHMLLTTSARGYCGYQLSIDYFGNIHPSRVFYNYNKR